MDDTPVEAREDPLMNPALAEHRATGNIAPRQRFRGNQDVRLDSMMFAREHAARPAQPRLDFIGDVHHTVTAADLERRGQKAVARHEYAFTLDGFDNETGDVPPRHFLFQRLEVVVGDRSDPWKEWSESVFEFVVAIDRESAQRQPV